MSHALSQSLSQQMRMEQRLTPQLIQSMAILQKPVAELEAYVNDALETNAALEVAEPEAEEPAEGSAAPRDSRTSGSADGETEDRFARLAKLTRAYSLDDEEYRPSTPPRAALRGEIDPKMSAMANAPGREMSLNEYLLEQWAVAELEDDVRKVGEAIINQIDPDGYLRVPLAEIVARLKTPTPLETANVALDEIQLLDPPGVGARDVVECLLLQLDYLPGDNRIERTLIQNHLDDIAHNRLPAIAKATGFTLGEINEAIRAIRSSLCLHPGLNVGGQEAPLIRPDVIVDYAETGGGLTVRLARGNHPPLRINSQVAALANSQNNGKEAREFAKKQVDAASTIIEAVNFRQNRILDVARALVEKQRDFFDVGPEGLRICRMSELAEELGCDPSTISRAVADKYLQCPRGIFPMRYFFTGGTETEEGETVGWDRVKNRVRELVDGEDKAGPLSDEQIVAILKKEGISLSRRTVTKYRKQLNIPSIRQRRQY
jgi:RNA polymerase sigma-54 factor